MKHKFLKWIMENIQPQLQKNKRCVECETTLEEIMVSFDKKLPFSITFRPDYNSKENATYWHIEMND